MLEDKYEEKRLRTEKKKKQVSLGEPCKSEINF